MHFLALTIVSVIAQTSNPQLNADLMTVWNGLRAQAATIADKDCSGEIVATFDEAKKIYDQFGLSNQFIDSLLSIQTVAGDIPESQQFRSDFGNMTSNAKVALEQVKSKPTSAATSTPTSYDGNYDYGQNNISGALPASMMALAVAVVACL